MKTLLLLPFALAACTAFGDDDGDPPGPPDPTPNRSCSAEVRARKLVTVSGTVVDFATGEPVAGATVDIGTAWDGTSEECPVIRTVVAGADGTFGPFEIAAGSLLEPSFVIFTVHGGDRAVTASDNRTCDQDRCTLDHTIAAPSRALATTWRTELAAGGMADAATRGLVAFEFRDPVGAGAAGVVPDLLIAADPPTRPLVAGSEVRFLAADRATVLPVGQATTTASGVVLVGTEGETAYIGGSRGGDRWFSTGCLVEDGVIFLEDRTQAP